MGPVWSIALIAVLRVRRSVLGAGVKAVNTVLTVMVQVGKSAHTASERVMKNVHGAGVMGLILGVIFAHTVMELAMKDVIIVMAQDTCDACRAMVGVMKYVLLVMEPGR